MKKFSMLAEIGKWKSRSESVVWHRKRPPLPPPSHLYHGCFGQFYRSSHYLYHFIRSFFATPQYINEELEELEHGGVVYFKPKSLQLMVAETKFTKKEIQTLYRTFKQVCPSGIVSLEEFTAFFARMFPQGDWKQYATFLFNSFHPSRPQLLDFDEIIATLSELCRGSREERLCWVFALYDQDNDGLITPSDIHEILTAVYALLGPELDDLPDEFSIRNHTLSMLLKFDPDRSGAITRDEFVETCLSDPEICESLEVFDNVPVC